MDPNADHLHGNCSNVDKENPTQPSSTLNVHPQGWLDEKAPEFHGTFIRESGWDLNECQKCHGTGYDGGKTTSSCLECHPKTPEDCTVCHGNPVTATAAPPKDLDNNTVTITIFVPISQ